MLQRNGLEYDLKNQFDDNIDKPVLSQISIDLENKVNTLIAKILDVVPDLEDKLKNIDKIESNNVYVENNILLEEFTIDTFNNKYKPLYDKSVEVDGNKVYADNITLRGSGLNKRIEATLIDDELQIDNEEIGFKYDGNEISNITGQYWFKSDMEDNEEFYNKVLKSVKELYNDMKKLQQPIEKEKPVEKEEPKTFPIHNEVNMEELIKMFREMVEDNPNNEKAKEFLRKYDNEFTESKKVETKEILDEKKKYWPPVYHEYNVDGHNFDFKCQYYEVSGSSQASLWGHDVVLRMDGNEIASVVVPYYNRTWETWEFQTAMLNAIGQYMETYKSKIFSDYRTNNNVKGIKSNQKEEILANDEFYQTLEKVYNEIRNGNKGKVEENKKLKTEDIDDENEEDYDPMDETISLLAQAYRDIPTIGIEDWGKDNELYFYIDTKKVLNELETYEIEIPKTLVDNASPDDWTNGIEDYLTNYLGINVDNGDSDNTYNWGSRLTHDMEIKTYNTENGFYVELSVHRDGDVRGNYTNDFLLKFDSRDDFYDAILDAQVSCINDLEYEGKNYYIEPHIFDEYVDISDENGNNWPDVYCEDLDQFKKIISSESEE